MESIEKAINNALNNSMNNNNNDNDSDHLTEQLSNSSNDAIDYNSEVSLNNGCIGAPLFIKPNLSSSYLNDSTSQDPFLNVNVSRHKRTLSQKYTQIDRPHN